MAKSSAHLGRIKAGKYGRLKSFVAHRTAMAGNCKSRNPASWEVPVARIDMIIRHGKLLRLAPRGTIGP